MNNKQPITNFTPSFGIYDIKYQDDRIYNDEKGRPVGLAGKVNKVTNSVERPLTAPLMTPEDKLYFDFLFEKCISVARQHLEHHAP